MPLHDVAIEPSLNEHGTLYVHLIANLEQALVAINENIVTLKVSMDHRRIKAMKILKPLQDLPTPMFDCSNVNSLVF